MKIKLTINGISHTMDLETFLHAGGPGCARSSIAKEIVDTLEKGHTFYFHNEVVDMKIEPYYESDSYLSIC